MINLTKNERRTLKLLLANARSSDSEIAAKLKISSQAVGQIRRKLEGSLIDSYSVSVNYPKLGILVFAVSTAKLTAAGLDKGDLEIEQLIRDTPYILQAFRLPKGSSTHIMLYGFRDIDEFDNFFHSPVMYKKLHMYLEIQDVYTFSHHSLIKNNSVPLFNLALEAQNPSSKKQFQELEHYKKRLK